jgi:histidinol-phosphate/aromatic aminotransferase/cobyric acid decarboxylase-like protein
MNKSDLKIKIKELKDNSGTHSPSIDTLLSQFSDFKINIDACFLSNPYATELFLNYLDNDLIKSNQLKNILEYYPPQNREVAKYISKAIGINSKNIFVGNGAIEIIQAILHNFVKSKIVIILPTFSSYYEFLKEDTNIIYYTLDKQNNFTLDIDDYISFLKIHNPDTIVILNPNNPNGFYLKKAEIEEILEKTKYVENVIIDESFIHFAYENLEFSQISSEDLISRYQNLVIIKSMSKDFGIAGIRAGYAVMNSTRVDHLLKNGYLWNVSGLANYFFKIYTDNDFIKKYDIARKKYIMNTMMFLKELETINYIHVYPSKANFALIELKNNIQSFDFTIELLLNNGIYVRDCSDKIGLNGSFIRIASRTFEENLEIINALKNYK